jgi:hypothetical protein
MTPRRRRAGGYSHEWRAWTYQLKQWLRRLLFPKFANGWFNPLQSFNTGAVFPDVAGLREGRAIRASLAGLH